MAQKLGQRQPFTSLSPQGMPGLTCIFWANLIPCSLQVLGARPHGGGARQGRGHAGASEQDAQLAQKLGKHPPLCFDSWFPTGMPGPAGILLGQPNTALAAVRGVVRGHALHGDRLLAARLTPLHDAGMLTRGGHRGRSAPLASRLCRVATHFLLGLWAFGWKFIAFVPPG